MDEVRVALVAYLVVLLLITCSPPTHSVKGASGCSAWQSHSDPPSVIRVLTRHNRIVRVPIRRYVLAVMGHEWPGYLPYALQQAGAVAVKQYAWWKAMHPRPSQYGCFDVHATTKDQIYRPDTARITNSHHLAVSSTWLTHILRDGRISMTGYRRGTPGRCGSDSTGWKLFALSGKDCARRGYSYRAILRVYYDGRIVN